MKIDRERKRVEAFTLLLGQEGSGGAGAGIIERGMVVSRNLTKKGF